MVEHRAVLRYKKKISNFLEHRTKYTLSEIFKLGTNNQWFYVNPLDIANVRVDQRCNNRSYVKVR